MTKKLIFYSSTKNEQKNLRELLFRGLELPNTNWSKKYKLGDKNFR